MIFWHNYDVNPIFMYIKLGVEPGMYKASIELSIVTPIFVDLDIVTTSVVPYRTNSNVGAKYGIPPGGYDAHFSSPPEYNPRLYQHCATVSKPKGNISTQRISI